ncbi:hypothetical protein [Candidatus Pantoea bituminis]|uniref:hypothetical protein n=1 Tax=Candidatus Pantoea bituminis TaxID=2831036 RepID=UPI001C064872|nr:hypothetical protein [Pantoea bituminis]
MKGKQQELPVLIESFIEATPADFFKATQQPENIAVLRSSHNPSLDHLCEGAKGAFASALKRKDETPAELHP